PRDVQRGRLLRAARNDERAQRLQLRISRIDGALELRDAGVVDARFLEMLAHLLAVGGREQRADGKEVALDGHEYLVDPRHRLRGAHDAEDRIQLVDVAVRFDAWMILGDAPAPEQPGVAAVSGLGVDLHGGSNVQGVRRLRCGAGSTYPSRMELKDITIIGG